MNSNLTVASREALGRLVREVWIEWAKKQPDAKASWLVLWEDLSESDKEVDRKIGQRLFEEGVHAAINTLMNVDLLFLRDTSPPPPPPNMSEPLPDPVIPSC